MDELTLEKPHKRFKETYVKGISQLIDNGYLAGKLDIKYISDRFDEYLVDIHNFEVGINIPEGFSRQSEFWAIRDHTNYLGTIKLKNSLCNEYLRTVGGNYSIYIVPTEQNKGYGGKITMMALDKAKGLGIKRLLACVSVSNERSRRIFERLGFKLERQAFHPKTGTMDRYWIDL